MFKTKSVYVLLIGLSMLLSSCDPDNSGPVDPAGTYRLVGKVSLNGSPVQGATIKVGESWTTTSNDSGKFELGGLPEGSLDFRIEKTYSNNSSTYKTGKVNLYTELNDLGEIQLSNPITLLKSEIETGSNTISVVWSKSSINDFLQYKVYRSSLPQPDDKTGELVYSSGNVSDTIFHDTKFRTGSNLYYRVYAYYTGERISSTNVTSLAIPEINLIINGSFEESQDGIWPNFWQKNIVGTPTFNFFNVSKDIAKTGQNSLQIDFNEDQSFPDPLKGSWGGLIQQIPTGDLKVGEEYAFSFWSKSDVGSVQVRLFKNGNESLPVVNYVVPSGQSWQEKKFTFKMESDINYLEIWINTKTALASNKLVKAYIDDVKLIK